MGCGSDSCHICGYTTGLSWGQVSMGECPRCKGDRDYFRKKEAEQKKLEAENKKLKEKLCPSYKTLENLNGRRDRLIEKLKTAIYGNHSFDVLMSKIEGMYNVGSRLIVSINKCKQEIERFEKDGI